MILTNEEFSLLKVRDETVLTKLYNHYAESLSTFFFIKTFGNHQATEDLTQETFYAIIKSAPRFKTPQIVQFTIFSIAKNKLADYQRKLFRHKNHTSLKAEIKDKSQDIIDMLDRKQRILLLKLAYESLNPYYREIYTMRYIKDKRIKEIAAHFKKSFKAIDSILVRIRKAIKKEMMRLAKDFFKDEYYG